MTYTDSIINVSRRRRSSSSSSSSCQHLGNSGQSCNRNLRQPLDGSNKCPTISWIHVMNVIAIHKFTTITTTAPPPPSSPPSPHQHHHHRHHRHHHHCTISTTISNLWDPCTKLLLQSINSNMSQLYVWQTCLHCQSTMYEFRYIFTVIIRFLS